MFPDLRIWRHPAVDHLEIVHVGRHRYFAPPHIHTSMAIIWNIHGVSQLKCRDFDVILNPGQACIVSPNEVISGGFLSGDYAEYIQINIPDMLIGRFGENIPFSVKTLQAEEARNLIPGLLTALMESRTEQDVVAVVQPIFGDIVTTKKNSVRRKLDGAITKAVRYILSRYNDNLDIKSISASLSLNDRYFIGLFKKATGTTPHQFQMAVRVEQARLLFGSELSLSDIAAAAGFSDQSHFIRCFKRQYGLPPGQIRQLMHDQGQGLGNVRLTSPSR